MKGDDGGKAVAYMKTHGVTGFAGVPARGFPREKRFWRARERERDGKNSRNAHTGRNPSGFVKSGVCVCVYVCVVPHLSQFGGHLDSKSSYVAPCGSKTDAEGLR